MIQTPHLPGFQDPVHQSQQTFRTLLQALAYPGKPQHLEPVLAAPPPLSPACAAACLTLLDFETQVWLQPLGAESSESQLDNLSVWIQFHTGCPICAEPQKADFGILLDVERIPSLSQFNPGSATDPEHSTTLLIQVPSIAEGDVLMLEGPGIAPEYPCRLQLPSATLNEVLVTRDASFPQGIDIFLLTNRDVVGLPRTTKIGWG